MRTFLSCGSGDGGSSSSSGTVSMNVTDAKPVLPVDNVESVSIKIEEVSVHKSGGGWITLTLAKPYTIDLLQFSDGTKTHFSLQFRLNLGNIRRSGLACPVRSFASVGWIIR